LGKRCLKRRVWHRGWRIRCLGIHGLGIHGLGIHRRRIDSLGIHRRRIDSLGIHRHRIHRFGKHRCSVNGCWIGRYGEQWLDWIRGNSVVTRTSGVVVRHANPVAIVTGVNSSEWRAYPRSPAIGKHID
jgi:hypothetical protein